MPPAILKKGCTEKIFSLRTNAVATEVNTFAPTGERTLPIEPEGKLRNCA